MTAQTRQDDPKPRIALVSFASNSEAGPGDLECIWQCPTVAEDWSKDTHGPFPTEMSLHGLGGLSMRPVNSGLVYVEVSTSHPSTLLLIGF